MFEVILTVHLCYYVEIKCQLAATDDFYCRSYCLLNMFRDTIMHIIRSSRVSYRWLLPVAFGALVFKLSVWCGAEGCVSGLRSAAPLCPSSGAREYYTGGCCLWYLVLWFSSCRYGVELRVMCPVCGLLHHYAHHQELESIIQMVAACGIWCFGFQVVGIVWS